ncbi:hypothetical protein B0G57_14212 [Trinickia symbiotica]|nr:hypothetical protein B0G57_14212 [Trinickia symbiotica]
MGVNNFMDIVVADIVKHRFYIFFPSYGEQCSREINEELIKRYREGYGRIESRSNLVIHFNAFESSAGKALNRVPTILTDIIIQVSPHGGRETNPAPRTFMFCWEPAIARQQFI